MTITILSPADLTRNPLTVTQVDHLVDLQIRLAWEDCPDYQAPERERLYRGVKASLAHGDWFLALDGYQVVGCARTNRMWSDWNADYRIFVDGVFVLKTHRRRGIARSLMRAIIDTHRGACDLQLQVRNPAAISLYRSLGFMTEGYTVMTRWNDLHPAGSA
jgi:ribosomal protein S18 acetylase RimI-like enzyme